ncbi:HAD-IA family hydrolase [Pseudomonas putida]|uniref:HAD-IA family hydrolase n=1 Tax=Pseudomonas putida TaxID=303 RepID=UPI003FD5CF19
MSAYDNVFDRAFGAFLFDMDGTVLNSIAAAERVWAAWARRHGVDVESFLPTIHGARAIDTIRRLNLPGVDAEAQAAFIAQAEIDDVEGIVQIPGAAAFLASLPAERWAMVTSAPRDLAVRRLAAAGIPEPALMITAEDVTAGKPDPAGYRLAAKRLGLDARDCLIFEDAAVGIQAAEAAGAGLLIISTTHQHPLETCHATIDSYEALRVTVDSQGQLHLQKT